MEELEYIKKFSSINITQACKKLGVDRSNLVSGRASAESVKAVKKELESELAKLYIKKEELKETKEGE